MAKANRKAGGIFRIELWWWPYLRIERRNFLVISYFSPFPFTPFNRLNHSQILSMESYKDLSNGIEQ